MVWWENVVIENLGSNCSGQIFFSKCLLLKNKENRINVYKDSYLFKIKIITKGNELA
jgi:hypothetical protein